MRGYNCLDFSAVKPGFNQISECSLLSGFFCTVEEDFPDSLTCPLLSGFFWAESSGQKKPPMWKHRGITQNHQKP